MLREGRVNLKQKRLPYGWETFLGGEGGIRTREPLWVTRFPSVRAKPDYATSPNIKRRGVSNSVGLATPFVPRARLCETAEHTETFEFFLRELSDLCGKGSFSPFF